ncbi:hypothetical protein BD311DRAFT_52143 [Dichomitus squalens]|uniref:Uncharacterized protein n=1 Tax=Dichomitus squalens TaxID=114155 RepID=A0A4Q9MWD7_9APHY|nr:hypothetical protein BD311DRAFT_52143 [Dichomitus squalens]
MLIHHLGGPGVTCRHSDLRCSILNCPCILHPRGCSASRAVDQRLCPATHTARYGHGPPYPIRYLWRMVACRASPPPSPQTSLEPSPVIKTLSTLWPTLHTTRIRPATPFSTRSPMGHRSLAATLRSTRTPTQDTALRLPTCVDYGFDTR